MIELANVMLALFSTPLPVMAPLLAVIVTLVAVSFAGRMPLKAP